jgi:hypothetical protein
MLGAMTNQFAFAVLSALALAASALSVSAAADGFEDPPLVVAGRPVVPPLLDGKLTDRCWAKASALGPFMEISTLNPPDEVTSAMLCWDPSNLYVAVDCAESSPSRIVAECSQPDSEDLFHDDSIEVFITLPGNAEYVHWAVNTRGLVTDERCRSVSKRDIKWNSTARTAVSTSALGWRVELTIPWKDLASRPPRSGDSWRMNVARNQRSRGEWSSWATTGGSLHQPEQFGFVRLANDDPGIRLESFERNVLGPCMAVLRTMGPRFPTSAFRVLGSTRMPPNPASVSADLSRISLAYLIQPADGRGIAFEVRAGSSVVYRSAEYPCARDRLDGEIARLARDASQWRGKMDRKDSRDLLLRQKAGEALEQAARVESRYRATADGMTSAQREVMCTDVDLAGWGFARLNAASSQLAASGGTTVPQYGTGIAPSTVKVLRDVPFRGEFAGEARIELCRNEYEACQIVIVPVTGNLEQVEVSVSDLAGPNGARITSSSLEIHRVGYVRTRRPDYRVDYVGWYPDPLMPLERFDVAAGQNQPIWIGVNAPGEAPPGTYRGKVIIRPANAAEQEVKLSVEVWNIALPKSTTLKTAFVSVPHAISKWYGLGKVGDQFRRDLFTFMLNRRINPGSIYSRTEYWTPEDIRWCLERGMNTFCVRCIGPIKGDTPAERDARLKELKEWAGKYAQTLRECGALDKAYVYGFDEVKPKDYPDAVEAFRAVKEAAPGLRTACTVVPNKVMAPYIDIWVPLTPRFEDRDLLESRKPSDEMWWYVCCSPKHPYANWFIDYSALEHRLLFWQGFKTGVTGILYYSTQKWESNRITKSSGADVAHEDPEALEMIGNGKRWPEVPWNTFTWDHINGDGLLIYPGPGQKLLSSQRLENIRDGIEDHELLQQLKLAADRLGKSRIASRKELVRRARELCAVRPGVVRDLTHYTQDPAVLAAERHEVAKLLVEINDRLREVSYD